MDKNSKKTQSKTNVISKVGKNFNGKEFASKAKEFMGKLSRGLMLPIAVLPVAGLFLGIGGSIAGYPGVSEGLETFGNFLKVPGDVVFGNLPVLFAISIAIAFTDDSGVAGLAALLG
jgi:PTS system glucose-specific IIC component